MKHTTPNTELQNITKAPATINPKRPKLARIGDVILIARVVSLAIAVVSLASVVASVVVVTAASETNIEQVFLFDVVVVFKTSEMLI